MRFGFLLSLLAAVLLGLALLSESWWARAALGWGALASAVPAAAYFFDRPRWLGKRLDGSISPTRVLLLLPFFLVTWGIWHLRRLCGAGPFDVVGDGLYVGRRPLAGELPRDATLVVDLTSEFREVAPIRSLPGYCCLPALDGRAPPIDEQTRARVRAIADHRGTVYVHCAVGYGRSAALAAAVLVIRGAAQSIAQAEQQMKQARRGIGLNACQRRWARGVAGVER